MSSTQLPPAAASYPFSFQSAAASFALSKKSSPLESSKSSLFWQNTRGGGTPENRPFGINNFQPLYRAPVCNLVTPDAGLTRICSSPAASRSSVSPATHYPPLTTHFSSFSTTHYSLPTTHLFSSSFIFITLRIAFPATPVFSKRSALVGGVGPTPAVGALRFFENFASCGKEEC